MIKNWSEADQKQYRQILRIARKTRKVAEIVFGSGDPCTARFVRNRDLGGECMNVSQELFIRCHGQIKNCKLRLAISPAHAFCIFKDRIIDLTATQFKYYNVPVRKRHHIKPLTLVGLKSNIAKDLDFWEFRSLIKRPIDKLASSSDRSWYRGGFSRRRNSKKPKESMITYMLAHAIDILEKQEAIRGTREIIQSWIRSRK